MMQNELTQPEGVYRYVERLSSFIAEKFNSKNSFMNFYLRYCLSFKLFKRQKLYTIRLVILICFSAVCAIYTSPDLPLGFFCPNHKPVYSFFRIVSLIQNPVSFFNDRHIHSVF